MSTDELARLRSFLGGGEEPQAASRRHGKYELLREIGRGAMAVVHEARDPDLGRTVALKVLREGALDRIRREATAAARLRHPNVIAVYEVGPDFIALELVPGRTLAQALPEMPRAERLRVLEVIARAAGHGHDHGIVHRDIKPENVFVEPEGRAVLGDFGLARVPDQTDLTRSGASLGTPHYMSPEQVRGEGRSIGPPSDVWALGVLLVQMVTDTRPFDGASIPVVYDKIVRSEPPALPGDLGAIASKALEKDPRRRYADGTAMAEDLARHLAGEPAEARSVGRLGRLWRRARRAPVLSAVVVGAALLTGLAASLAILGARGEARVLESVRAQARLSLEAALALRRAGAVDRMRQFLGPLEAAYHEAAAKAPGLAEPEFLMGRMHRALLADERALAFQERSLAKDPGFAPALYERAVLLSLRAARQALAEPFEASGADGSSSPAIAAWDAFRTSPGRSPDAGAERLALGMLAYHRGKYTEARGHLDAAVRADPGREEAWEALGHVARADRAATVEERERHAREQEALYTARIERDQGYVPYLLGRGHVRFWRGTTRRHRGLDPRPDYMAAIEDFDRVVALDPRSAEAWTWRGRVHVYVGIWKTETGGDPRPDCTSAEKDLSKGIALDGHLGLARLWRGAARFYLATHEAETGLDPLDDFAAADKDLSEAVRLDPGLTEASMWRGRARAQHGAAVGRAGRDPRKLFEGADEDFTGVAKARSTDVWFWMWRSTVASERALWLAARGDDPEAAFTVARSQLDRAIERGRHLMEAWRHRGVLQFHRARHLEQIGRRDAAQASYAAAAADLLQAISLNPVLEGQIGAKMREALRKADSPPRP